MPRELRQIILARDEVIGAIDSYRRTSPQALPQGDVLSYSANANGGLRIGMKLSYGSTQQVLDIDLDGPQIVQLLAKFCIENNIMLPRNSEKSYKLVNDELILIIRINMTA
jgi:hypothetical protein